MKAIETFTTTTNHSTFGGIIDIEDFSTFSPSKKRINKYAEAENLQSVLEEKKEYRKMEEIYKNMTLEELRKMKLISNTNGRPTSTLTDEKWQKEFNIRKMFVKPVDKTITKMGGLYSRDSGMWNEELQGIYNGTTSWQSYCSFVNDVLKVIRSGQVDYVYYIYQIMDLLKFHYNTLRTKYCDGYWEVWLDR